MDLASRMQDGWVVDDLKVAGLQHLADMESWILSQSRKGPAYMLACY